MQPLQSAASVWTYLENPGLGGQPACADCLEQVQRAHSVRVTRLDCRVPGMRNVRLAPQVVDFIWAQVSHEPRQKGLIRHGAVVNVHACKRKFHALANPVEDVAGPPRHSVLGLSNASDSNIPL